jgi:hypothetical protein
MTKHHYLPLAVLALCAVTAAPAAEENFDVAKPDVLPAGWQAAQTGEGKPRWAVVADATAPSKPHALKQSGTADYPLCLKTDAKLKDGFVEVKFKALSGEEDQAGGVVWRARDAKNYCIARANALEGNVRIYRFVDGKRTQFGGVKHEVAAGQWHTLRVEFTGARHKVFFNGKQLFEAEDATITDAGAVGLWTKADSVTLFDDFRFGEGAK